MLTDSWFAVRTGHHGPVLLWVLALLLVALVMLPLAVLSLQAAQWDVADWRQWMLRPRTGLLVRHTVLLAMGVALGASLIALPVAYLTAHTDLPGRRFWTLCGILPLAIPAYLLAYTLLSLGGLNGVIARLTPLDTIPRLGGYFGAWLVLSIANAPYLFVTVRTGLVRLDPALEETARSLGAGPWEVLRRIVVPQLVPAYASGLVLVLLHVIGDFGVVSLMRYETLSYSLYTSLFDRPQAAAIALLLVSGALALLVCDALIVRVGRLDRAGTGVIRERQPIALGDWTPVVLLALSGLVLTTLGIPLGSLLFWSLQAPWPDLATDMTAALRHSLTGAVPAALLTPLGALLVAWLARRHASVATAWLERAAIFGYATPPLAFALGWVVVALTWPDLGLYQSLALLIAAYSFHFLAEAVGPVRTALQVASPRLEEASRALGIGATQTWWRVTFPLIRGGLGGSAALVLLSCLKELPITMVLAPLGHHTLAYNVYDRTTEADFAGSAPYALLILVFAALLTMLLLPRSDRLDASARRTRPA